MEVTGVTTVRVTAQRGEARQEGREAQKVLEAVEATPVKEQRPVVKQTEDSEEVRKQLSELAVEMNEMAKPLQTRIRFGFSDEAGMMYLNVIDGDSGQVIRQFPSNEAIEFAAKMREWVGMLLDKKI